MLKYISLPRALLLAIGIASCGSTLMAQNNAERSPYSRFGYGSINRPVTAGLRGMGGVGYGVRDMALVNPSNPASYTAVDSMTFIFDVGISGGISLLSESGVSDKKYLGNIDYITMLFPIGKRFAMSAGIMPFAKTGYEFGSLQTLSGDANTQSSMRSYSGQGGYNQIYIGLGAKLFEGLSVGANVAYIVGDRTIQSRYELASSTANFNNRSDNLRLTGLKFDLGAQYTHQLDEAGTRSLTFGALVTPPVSLSNERAIIGRNTTTSGAAAGTSEITQNDTIRDRDYTLPLGMGVGVSYRVANKLLLAGDVQYSMWERAKFEELEAQFQNQWRVALGVEYTPNYRQRSLWKRAKYRLGLSGANSYLQIPAGAGAYSSYYELGVSAGIGLPLIDRRSSLNLSIEYKHLQPKVSGLITERYIGATLGIVFNEGWFRKARVN